MKDIANTRLYSAQYPGIFLTTSDILVWFGEQICHMNGLYKTPLGSFTKEFLVTIFETDTCLPLVHWQEVKFEYVDDDASNNTHKNAIMIFPDGGIECTSMPGFYYVPRFTRYVVNEEGKVYIWSSKREIIDYGDSNCYRVVSIKRDGGGYCTVGIHRVLAMAFFKFDKTIVRLDVNHKNGIKWDNKLENLELVTRKQNCDHAYSTGLRSENIPVQVKSIYTGQVLEFYSVNECARELGMHHVGVLTRLESNGQKIYRPGLLIKRANSTTPWKQINDSDFALTSIGVISKIVLKSGNLAVCADTYFEAAAITGILPNTIRWRFFHWESPVKLGKFEGKFESYEKECKSLFAGMRRMNIS